MAERHRALADISNMTGEAAAVTITSGSFNITLKWEHGRSIVWSQILQFRSSMDDLRANHYALASRLEQISRELEYSGTRDAFVEFSPPLTLEEVRQIHHRLAAEWDILVARVRSLPGFEGFLQPKTVLRLRGAARVGPVVVINVHSVRCDALVLCADKDDVIHIPLENFSYRQAEALQNSLNNILSENRLRTSGATVVPNRPPKGDDTKLKELLSELWLCVVKPILDGLGYPISRAPEPPPGRIWWCATGPLAFLPLHAAGLYSTEDPGSEIGNYVTSSYAPTLTALLEPPRVTRPDKFQILAVSQPSTLGSPSLSDVRQELVRIRNYASSLPVRSLEGAQATVEHVVEGMKECSWVHLAYHGTQHTSNPTQSALPSHDGGLKLMELIKTPLRHTEFAFISAYQTATGEEQLSEEAVRLAGEMLLGGYRGVISTTWPIRHNFTPFVVDVYARLLENHQADRTRAAHALHRAVQQLRKVEGVSLLSWVSFIHIGM